MENIRGKFTSDLGQNFTLSSSNLVEMGLNELRMVGRVLETTSKDRAEKTINPEKYSESKETQAKTNIDKHLINAESKKNLIKSLQDKKLIASDLPEKLQPNFLDDLEIVKMVLNDKTDPDAEFTFPAEFLSKYDDAEEVREAFLTNKVQNSHQFKELINSLGINQRAFFDDTFEGFWDFAGDTDLNTIFQMSSLHRNQKIESYQDAKIRISELASKDLANLTQVELAELMEISKALNNLQSLKNFIEKAKIEPSQSPKLHPDYIKDFQVALTDDKNQKVKYQIQPPLSEEDTDEDEEFYVDFTEQPALITALISYVEGGLDNATRKGHIKFDGKNNSLSVNSLTITKDKDGNDKLYSTDIEDEEEEGNINLNNLTSDDIIALVYQVASEEVDIETNSTLTEATAELEKSASFKKYKKILDQIRLDNKPQQSKETKDKIILEELGFNDNVIAELNKKELEPILHTNNKGGYLVEIKSKNKDKTPILIYQMGSSDNPSSDTYYGNIYFYDPITSDDLNMLGNLENNKIPQIGDYGVNNDIANKLNDLGYKFSFYKSSTTETEIQLVIKPTDPFKTTDEYLFLNADNNNYVTIDTENRKITNVNTNDEIKIPIETTESGYRTTTLETIQNNEEVKYIASIIANPHDNGAINEDYETLTHEEKLGEGGTAEFNESDSRYNSESALYEHMLNQAENNDTNSFDKNKLATYLNECLIFGIIAIQQDPKYKEKYETELKALGITDINQYKPAKIDATDLTSNTDDLFSEKGKLNPLHREMIKLGMRFNDQQKNAVKGVFSDLATTLEPEMFQKANLLFAAVHIDVRDPKVISSLKLGYVYHIPLENGNVGIGAWVDPLTITAGTGLTLSFNVADETQLHFGAGIKTTGGWNVALDLGAGFSTEIHKHWFIGGGIGAVNLFGQTVGFGLAGIIGESMEKAQSIKKEEIYNEYNLDKNKIKQFEKLYTEYQTETRTEEKTKKLAAVWNEIKDTEFVKNIVTQHKNVNPEITPDTTPALTELYANLYAEFHLKNLNELSADETIKEHGGFISFHFGALVHPPFTPFAGIQYTSGDRKIVKYIVPDSQKLSKNQQQSIDKNIINQLKESAGNNEVVIQSESNNVYFDKAGNLVIDNQTELENPAAEATKTNIDKLNAKTKANGITFSRIETSENENLAKQDYIYMELNQEFIGNSALELHIDSKTDEATNGIYLNQAGIKMTGRTIKIPVNIEMAQTLILTNRQILKSDGTSTTQITLSESSTNLDAINRREGQYLRLEPNGTEFTLINSIYSKGTNTNPSLTDTEDITARIREHRNETIKKTYPAELLETSIDTNSYSSLFAPRKNNQLNGNRKNELNNFITNFVKTKEFTIFAQQITANTNNKQYSEAKMTEAFQELGEIKLGDKKISELPGEEQQYLREQLYYRSFIDISKLSQKAVINKLREYKKLTIQLLKERVKLDPKLAKFKDEKGNVKKEILDTLSKEIDKNITDFSNIPTADWNTKKFVSLSDEPNLSEHYLHSVAAAKQKIKGVKGFREFDSDTQTSLRIFGGIINTIEDPQLKELTLTLTDPISEDMEYKDLLTSELAIKVATMQLSKDPITEGNNMLLLPSLLMNQELMGDQKVNDNNIAKSHTEKILNYLNTAPDEAPDGSGPSLDLFKKLLTAIRSKQFSKAPNITSQFSNGTDYTITFSTDSKFMHIEPCANGTFATKQDIEFSSKINFEEKSIASDQNNTITWADSNKFYETSAIGFTASASIYGGDGKKGGGEKEPPKESTATDETDGGPIPPDDTAKEAPTASTR